mmetsp:Transcript_25322/g.57583  ORF Transcript_25322/g.57583 Transcript_25322/m.57583 type:complete len:450 (+) Transcript_25322:93-1442(+)
MASFFPISEISTFNKGWTICARVTNKSGLRNFSKKGGGGGKVFNVDLLDASGSAIRANFFNEKADEVFEKLQVGKCFAFSQGAVRIANKQFNTTAHKYELVFDREGVVEEAADDTRIETFKLSISDLQSVGTRKVPCKVDLCGVVVEAKPMTSLTSKDGKELAKRDITLADHTGVSISIILWAERAKLPDDTFANHPVVALKGVLVREYNHTRSGSLLEEGAIVLRPEIPQALQVQQWWAQGGSTQSLSCLSMCRASGDAGQSRVVSLSEMKESAMQGRGAMQMFVIICRLGLVLTRRSGEPMPLFYNACKENKGDGHVCHKRVDDGGFCPGCNRLVTHKPRLNVRCLFADSGDTSWICTFHEPAVEILGMDAEELAATEFGDGGSREALEAAVQKRYMEQPMQIMARAQLGNFNGEARVNVACFDACPVDRGEHGREMLQEIREMLGA